MTMEIRQERDYRDAFENDLHDDIEATDDSLKSVAYTFISFLAFVVCVICAVIFLI